MYYNDSNDCDCMGLSVSVRAPVIKWLRKKKKLKETKVLFSIMAWRNYSIVERKPQVVVAGCKVCSQEPGKDKSSFLASFLLSFRSRTLGLVPPAVKVGLLTLVKLIWIITGTACLEVFPFCGSRSYQLDHHSWAYMFYIIVPEIPSISRMCVLLSIAILQRYFAPLFESPKYA